VTTAPRPLPELDDVSSPFWEACARHELVLQTCASCGTVRHPPRPVCPACLSWEYAWKPAGGRGRVWSWVIAHPPVLPAFADKAPYNVAVVELDEGVRMLANLHDLPNDEIREGMRVEVTWEDVEDGVTLPQWRPAR
jgi:uncharacterized OB-fold protein